VQNNQTMRMYLVVCIDLKLNHEMIIIFATSVLSIYRIEMDGVTAVTVLLLYILTD